jgi:hypothetical protein
MLSRQPTKAGRHSATISIASSMIYKVKMPSALKDSVIHAATNETSKTKERQ